MVPATAAMRPDDGQRSVTADPARAGKLPVAPIKLRATEHEYTWCAKHKSRWVRDFARGCD